ncbi:S8 family peptidase [Parvularcula maris]|uniref:S8 family serine peptidase n=1 Tax=Parvularcula maris TaxID=2965077 RepID=A0A9X2RIF0_9PROT|nr:S8 family peptidase [Parvularcula maris]MCQ8185985.1 S8 family serine peptidase [Parvularcula maris]
MKKYLVSTCAAALVAGIVGSTAFATDFTVREMHLDPLEMHLDPLEMHLDPLEMHLDPLEMHLDPLEMHLDPLEMHLDPLEMHLDPLEMHLDPLEMHLDPLEMHLDPLEMHLDPLSKILGSTIFTANEMHLDPLEMHLDPLEMHLDPLEMHLDPLEMHLDPLEMHLDPLEMHLDPLEMHLDPLALGFVALQYGSLSGNQAMMSGQGSLFWGTFRPMEMHLDPLEMHLDPLEMQLDPLEMQLDPLEMHLDPLALFIDPLEMHLDPLEMHLDPLEMHLDPLEMHLDPLEMHLDPLEMHLDPLALFIDPLEMHLDPLEMHLDPLGLFASAMEMHLDPLEMHLDPLEMHLDPLEMHLDPLEMHLDPLEMHLDPLEMHLDPLEMHLDPLAVQLYVLSAHLRTLEMHLDPLEMHLDPLEMHLDPLMLRALNALSLSGDGISFERFEMHLDPLRQLGDLAAELAALEQTLGSLDMVALEMHLDPLAFAEVQRVMGAMGGLSGLTQQMTQVASAVGSLIGAYDTYQDLYTRAEERYGSLIEAETGLGFTEGFLEGFFEKHGLEGSGFGDFLAMSEADRTRFLIDFNDQLFTFVGVDHPDHWMSAVKWSPRLSEIAGYGEGVTIGVVDQAFEGAGPLAEAPELDGGIFAGQNHGRAVAGLAAGALDGEGVMGVAPNATVTLSNPFDAQSYADEQDVMASITAVGRAGASIINLSIGESGATFAEGWDEVFQNGRVAQATRDALFVLAAGNDGVVQEFDVNMNGTHGAVERIILVGAIDPRGNIASFSNTPGDACFTVGSDCVSMASRFLVAPGQQLLVATEDGIGRTSGTSFATPIVSGAAALLQSRWEWLQQEPEATAEILFRSADDLGAPGVDAVYGHGLLNVSASQRPLDINALRFEGAGLGTSVIGAGLTPQLMARVDPTASLTAFETVGNTFRDFEIPVGVLTTSVIDPGVSLETAAETVFAGRLGTPIGTIQSVAGLSVAGQGFTDAGAVASQFFGGEGQGFTLTLEARKPAHGLAVPEGAVPFETHGELTSERTGLAFRFGHGAGALAFTGDSFAMVSDHDVLTGGVNPVLGLASGGAYLQLEGQLTGRLSFSGGITHRQDADLVVNPFSGELTERVAGTEGYSASAVNAALGYAVTEGTSFTFGYTLLQERQGFLGGQSVGGLSFGEAAQTGAVTVGVESALPFGLQLSGSASAGRTTGAGAASGLLGIDEGGILTSSYQLAVSKRGLFGEDRVRFSIAQPLHVESGDLALRTLDVIDRETGERAVTADLIGVDRADRRYVAEVLYGRPVLDGRSELSLFAQHDTDPLLTAGQSGTTAGIRFRSAF